MFSIAQPNPLFFPLSRSLCDRISDAVFVSIRFHFIIRLLLDASWKQISLLHFLNLHFAVLWYRLPYHIASDTSSTSSSSGLSSALKQISNAISSIDCKWHRSCCHFYRNWDAFWGWLLPLTISNHDHIAISNVILFSLLVFDSFIIVDFMKFSISIKMHIAHTQQKKIERRIKNKQQALSQWKARNWLHLWNDCDASITGSTNDISIK